MTDATTQVATTTTLPDGIEIPLVGLGMLRVPDAEAYENVRAAFDAGYRHVDTAAVYGNEAGVGQAIRESGIARSDLFLTTKVWNQDHGYDRTMAAFDASMARLGVDYVDLYLIHWPVQGDIIGSWRALQEIKAQGRTRSIGVSNFLPKHLDDLARESDERPSLNQIELHPWMQQSELRAYHQEHGIRTEAWSPLGQGHVIADPVIVGIAERLGRTPAQVILRWHLDLGSIVIPKSKNPERLASNIDVFDFALSEEDHALLAGLDKGHRFGTHPDTPPTVPLPY